MAISRRLLVSLGAGISTFAERMDAFDVAPLPEPPDRKNLISYLFESIKDMQGTIRATDTKLSAMIVALSIPLVRLSDVTTEAQTSIANIAKLKQPAYLSTLETLLLLVPAITWLLSYTIAFVALRGIHNPEHLIHKPDPSLSFYLPGMHSPVFSDYIFSPKQTSQKANVAALYLIALNATDDNLIHSLVFEQLKLAIIRDVKVRRFHASFIFAAITMVSVIVLFELLKFSGIIT